jgi:hypothetical protein
LVACFCDVCIFSVCSQSPIAMSTSAKRHPAPNLPLQWVRAQNGTQACPQCKTKGNFFLSPLDPLSDLFSTGKQIHQHTSSLTSPLQSAAQVATVAVGHISPLPFCFMPCKN